MDFRWGKDGLLLDVNVHLRATFAAENFLVLGQEAFSHQGDRAPRTVKALAVPLAVLKADELVTSETCKGIGERELSILPKDRLSILSGSVLGPGGTAMRKTQVDASSLKNNAGTPRGPASFWECHP